MVRLTIDRTCRLALFILVLAISLLMAFDEARAELITFDEYPKDTPITNQYQNRGVIFSGEPDPPVILRYSDGSGGALKVSDSSASMIAFFVDPTDGVTLVEATNVSFEAYFLYYVACPTTITYYDLYGGIIRQDEWGTWLPDPPPPPTKFHKFVITRDCGNFVRLDNLSFQTAGPPETEWIYPDSVNMGENYNIILRVHNPSDKSKQLSFSLKETRLDDPLISWPLDEERVWQLDGRPYNGKQKKIKIGPHQTVDFVFTLNHYWQWIAPWDVTRFFDIVANIVLTMPGFETASLTKTLVEQVLGSVMHVNKIDYFYEGNADSQRSTRTIDITVPVSKKLAWGGSVLTGISAGKCTSAGLVALGTVAGAKLGIALLIIEAALIVSAEVEYAVAADPVVDYTQLASAEPVPLPAVCIPDEEPASTVADLCSRLLGTLIALQKSYVRYDAAEDDGSLEWMARQHGLAQMYADEAAQIKDELASLASSFLSLPILVPDGTGIEDIRQMIADSGLPEIEECILTELGYTPEEIEGIVEDTIGFPDDFFENFHDLPTTLSESAKSHELWSENLPPLPEGLTSVIFDVDPDTLKEQNKGGWINVYIELPEGHNVSDINCSNVTLAEYITPQRRAHSAGDYDGDGVSDLKVKFARREVMNVLDLGNNIIPVTVTIEGDVVIAGTVIIRLIHK